jgi:hypothetical protein
MADERRRRRRRPRPAAEQPPEAPAQVAEPRVEPRVEPRAEPRVEPRAEPPGRRRAQRDPSERGLRDLVGSGRSILGVEGALRGRDVNRPTEEDLAQAEREVEIVRRHWTPDSRG